MARTRKDIKLPRVAVPKPTRPHKVKGRDEARVNTKAKLKKGIEDA